jgi:7-alpha-hydroxysteroid dehydrogenase
VNNAGGTQPAAFRQLTADYLEGSFRFNILAPFELTRLAVPHMLNGPLGGGAVVNISSMAGIAASRGMFGHSLSKATLNQLTRLLAAELAPRIRVNAVLPGAIETAALKRYLDTLPEHMKAEMRERTPMRRNGTPEDIAAAVLYYASPASGWVTGNLHQVHGLANPEIIPRRIPDFEPGDL